MIQKQNTYDPSSNVSIGRAKNNSVPQKPSLEHVQTSNEEVTIPESIQEPHKLPKGVNQFGHGDYQNTHPYTSNPQYDGNDHVLME
jgi:hypothetical protein